MHCQFGDCSVVEFFGFESEQRRKIKKVKNLEIGDNFGGIY